MSTKLSDAEETRLAVLRSYIWDAVQEHDSYARHIGAETYGERVYNTIVRRIMSYGQSQLCIHRTLLDIWTVFEKTPLRVPDAGWIKALLDCDDETLQAMSEEK